MPSETDWITAAATVGGTVVGLILAVIAIRSAFSPDRSAEATLKTLHRSAVRELVSKCHELIEEELRIQLLVTDLRMELMTLSVFSGSYGNSGIEMLKKQLDRDLETATEGTRDAKRLVKSPQELVSASANDLDLWQAKIEASRAKLRTSRESITRELERISIQNQQSRERSLNNRKA